MTNLVPRSSVPDRFRRDPEEAERALGLVIYGMYLAAPLTLGVSGLVGSFMAASRARRDNRGLASHFRYQVWSFGAALGAAMAGGLWAALGGLATVADRTGGDLVLAGAGLAVASGVGFLAATLFGMNRLAAREPIGPSGSR